MDEEGTACILAEVDSTSLLVHAELGLAERDTVVLVETPGGDVAKGEEDFESWAVVPQRLVLEVVTCLVVVVDQEHQID